MVLVPKWLRDWIARLTPQQASSGNGAVHMGDVGGSVHNVTQVHHHFYATAPPEQTTPVSTVAARAITPPPTQSVVTAAHKDVLASMKRLPEPVRIKVLDFMRREFKTGMVIELQPSQLLRVRRYVETINQRSAGQKERA